MVEASSPDASEEDKTASGSYSSTSTASPINAGDVRSNKAEAESTISWSVPPIVNTTPPDAVGNRATPRSNVS